MNMPAESSPFAFPKLDGSNYTSWKEDMMDRGCWSFIIGEDKPGPEQPTEKEKFDRRNHWNFLKRVDEKKTQVKEAGFEIPELLIALQLIRGLPAEYNRLVQILYRLKDEEFNHREVEKELVNEAGRIQLKQKDLNLDYTENAYTVG
ncbi:hypothetical protein AVEN_273817-1 [Araneus ventricosus]|uniref:DUF4219 domain-containing protein n=1 Tax=Araneus ventricosus TaxID=182803 RepID=A0A4Y2VNP4_ARAVE|nr:hypothetical protein AVEN_273817-1 [Araneus ventricosus]